VRPLTGPEDLAATVGAVVAGVPPRVPAPFSVSVAPGQLVTTAIHAGHQLRPALAELVALDADDRRREEDPYTDQLLGEVGVRVHVHQSRFEVDLNRARDEAVYEHPDDAWGLNVWKRELPSAEIERSRTLHDQFYAELADHMDRLAAQGPVLVLDLHSYNHHREGPDGPPAAAGDNPEVNVGTGALDRPRWGHVVDVFIDQLRTQTVDGRPLDVRENVRFRGGHLSRWVAANYPDTACTLALEFKKLFMDEWTGECDTDHIAQLRHALHSVVPTVLATLAEPPVAHG
jgi:N-formylglutamate deformylase